MQHSQKYQHFALDANNNIIDIHSADKVCEKRYFCPHCHNEMIAKRGNVRQWHFAHKTEKCSYDKYLHSIAEKMIMDWFNPKGKHCFRNGSPSEMQPVRCLHIPYE